MPAVAPLSRRAAVRLGAGGLGVVGLAVRAPGTAMAQGATPAVEGARATFVLVPGAWAGAWAWEPVAELLRAAGHAAHPVTPTGLGDRAHLASPAIDLDTHVTDVVNMLEYAELQDVTLVGWSYGGMIITGVAERTPERLARLVYFDADVPADGENGWDAELYPAEGIVGDVASGKDAGLPGFLAPEPYADWIRSLATDPAEGEWYLAKLVPQSLATYIQPIRLGNPAAQQLPRAFVFCTEGKGDAATDHTVRTAERVRSDPAWQYREMADTHLGPLNDPRRAADLLLSLV